MTKRNVKTYLGLTDQAREYQQQLLEKWFSFEATLKSNDSVYGCVHGEDVLAEKSELGELIYHEYLEYNGQCLTYKSYPFVLVNGKLEPAESAFGVYMITSETLFGFDIIPYEFFVRIKRAINLFEKLLVDLIETLLPYQKEEPQKKKSKNKRSRTIPIKARYKAMSAAGGKCQLCGRRPSLLNEIKLHVDHIFPYSKGGTHDVHNLQVLCNECNLGKSNKDDSDFRTEQLLIQETNQ